jgi:N-acetyl-anhydromuramoyl-L-alanine amidase
LSQRGSIEPQAVWAAGWHRAARCVPSPNCGPRPHDGDISLAIVHSISLPPGEYGGDAIERFFLNRLDFDAHAYFDRLRGLQVSAHFLVRRDGDVVQFVSVLDRAWHAGASCWRGRDNCNDYSVGIELEGLEGEPFERAQYTALARLLRDCRRQWPGVAEVVGHEHVAPGRKGDPGAAFDWALLARDLRWSRARFAALSMQDGK